ncbi:MAG: hypothetical protein ACK4R6_09470 [Spirosomataceae bacterium]
MGRFSMYCICLLLYSFMSFGQDTEDTKEESKEEISTSFLYDGVARKVEWQKVFLVDSKIQVNTIRDYFIKSKIIVPEIVEEKEVYGIIPLQKIDVVKFGYTVWEAPIAFRSVFGADVKIEIKKGRYRVTVSNIHYIDNGDTDLIVRALFMMAPTSKGNKHTLNGVYTFKEDGEVRTRTKSVYTILDKFYTDLFTMGQQAKKSDF